MPRSTLQIQGLPDGDEANTVTVKYTKPVEDSSAWLTDTFTVIDEYVDAGTQPVIGTTLDLPGVYRMSEASNKAILKLRRDNNRQRISFVTVDDGIIFQPGDVVELNDSNRGITGISVYVEQAVMISYGRWRITGIRYRDTDYSDECYTEPDEVGKWVEPLGNPVVYIDCLEYQCDSYETALGDGGCDYWLMNDRQYSSLSPEFWRKNGSETESSDEPQLKLENSTGGGSIPSWTLSGLDICSGAALGYEALFQGTNTNFYINPEPWPTDELPRIRGSILMSGEQNGVIASGLRRVFFDIGGSTGNANRQVRLHIIAPTGSPQQVEVYMDGSAGKTNSIWLDGDFWSDGSLHLIQWDGEIVFDGYYVIPGSGEFLETGHTEGTVKIDGVSYDLASTTGTWMNGQSVDSGSYVYGVSGISVSQQNELFRHDGKIYGYSQCGPVELPDLYQDLLRNSATYVDPNCA